MSSPDHTRRATLFGLGAIVLWGMLAALTTWTKGIPPFQLTAMTFAIGGITSLVYVAATGRLARLRCPAKAWALGICGLFGYHAAYFASLKLAPAAEASLINYLWPLLIVVFTGFLPGEKLHLRHLLGALLGLCGVVALAFGREKLDFSGTALPGYLLALFAAFIWAGYSVLSRRMASVPTETVAGFCLVTAILPVFAMFCSKRRLGQSPPVHGCRSSFWVSVRSVPRSSSGIRE